MLFKKYLTEDTTDFYDVESEELEQTIVNFVVSLPEHSLTDELEKHRDEIINLSYKIFENIDAEHLEDEFAGIYMSIVDEIDPSDENTEDGDAVSESDELSEKIYLNRMSRAEKRKAKKYRRVNKVKLKRQRTMWRRKNKAKLKRAATSGIGVSGKRLGLHKRRKPL